MGPARSTRSSRRGLPDHTTRHGRGSNPLHVVDLRAVEMSTRVSISARSVTDFPGADRPSTIPRVPSGSTGTFMKKLTLPTMSALPRPCRAPSARKFSTQRAGVGVVPVAQCVRLLRARAAEGVVVAHVVGDDRHHRPRLLVADDGAGGEEDRTRCARWWPAPSTGSCGRGTENNVSTAWLPCRSISSTNPPAGTTPDHGARGPISTSRRTSGARVVVIGSPWWSVVSGDLMGGVRGGRLPSSATARAYSGSASPAPRTRSARSSWAAHASTSTVRRRRSAPRRADGRCRRRRPRTAGAGRGRRAGRSRGSGVDESAPSASTRTPWKNDRVGGTSAGPRPCFAAARTNSSRPRGPSTPVRPTRTGRVRRERRGSAQRVVVAGGVGDDGREHATLVAEQRVAGCPDTPATGPSRCRRH